jgi:phage-related holin
MKTLSEDFTVKAVIATVLSLAQVFLADHLIPLLILLALVAADAVTGIARAMQSGTFKSSKFRHTGIKLFCYVTMIGSTHLVSLLSVEVAGWHLDRWLTTYFAVTELLSIGENVEDLTGIKLPTRLLGLLRKILGRKG